MICVIGSHALNKALFKKTGLQYRKPVDMDIVCTLHDATVFAQRNLNKIVECYPSQRGTKHIFKGETSIIPQSNIIEAEIAWNNSIAEELHAIILNDPETIYEDGFAYASLDVCYMLKMSHRFLKNNPHFLKTMRDIHNLRKFGAKIRKEHEEFFKRRERDTYYYKHPKLNKGKAEFFNGDGVTYLYDHDSIHKSIAIDAEPAYTRFQSDNAEVMCDMKKFFALDEQVRLNAVYEETCVLALERSIIPFGTNYQKAFLMALEKVCTSITSGKFREYSWENYDTVRKMFTETTFDKFFDDIMQDKVDMAVQK